jgi:hypothetical protein
MRKRLPRDRETCMKHQSTPLFSRLGALALALPALGSAAVNFFNPLVPSAVPESLSATGIYSNIVNKTLDTAAKYFEVNAALWSDAAHKDRWIILPPGKQIPYVDTTDVFDYPDSTIFVKLFRHDTVTGDTSSRIYWETRLLVKRTQEGSLWYGFSYRWNKAGTQAYLVNRQSGFDTVLMLASAPGDRKWHFPTVDECDQCHRTAPGTRGVLGFWPAQLKRPSKADTSVNQVIAFFNSGLFIGVKPTQTLGKRFRGIAEPIPGGLSAADRFKVIDTMARSYIAANCSGCHGNKGLPNSAAGNCSPNYDYYNLTPMMEFSGQGLYGWGLEGPDTASEVQEPPRGRALFLASLREWGMATGPGGFDMAHGPDKPDLMVPGHPGYSTLLFRQAARRSPAADSGDLYRSLYFGGNPNQGWKSWIFKAKWGSKAWKDSLRAHNVTVAAALNLQGGLSGDGSQMPPLATFIPDTAALKILGEWGKNYPANTAVRRGNAAGSFQGIPALRNRMLILPPGWSGKVVMSGLNGRAYPLSSAGPGRYALPAVLPPGVYFFKVGDRSFRTSILK